ncbi:hypothetical protein LA6_004866 [Marinibacterium anthonyi]|nr:hypothetical protein LA6_004866 [Marinibacterium anthonyi]
MPATDIQVGFLEKYLGFRPSAAVLAARAQAAAREAERKYRERKAQFEAITAQFAGLAPAADPDVGQLAHHVTQMTNLEGAQDFAAALAELEQAVLLAGDILTAVTNLKATADKLRGILATMPALPAGATPADQAVLTQAQTDMTAALQDEYPTPAEVIAAQTALANVEAIRDRLADEALERAALEAATAELDAVLPLLHARIAALHAHPRHGVRDLAGLQLEAYLADFQTALATNDPGDIHAQYNEIDNMRQRLTALDRALDGDSTATLQAQIQGRNVTPEQQTALIALGKLDQRALTKVNDKLQTLEADAGARSAATFDDKLASEARLLTAFENLQIVRTAANANLGDATLAQALNQAQADYDAAVDQALAIRDKRLLIRAVTAGPLSGDAPRKLPRGVVNGALDLFDKNAPLASEALDAASHSKSPEAVLAFADLCCDSFNTSFEATLATRQMTTEDAIAYATSLIKLSGKIPAEYLAEFQDYIFYDRHWDDRGNLDATGKTAEQVTQDRVKHVTDRLVRDDGTLDIAAGRQAMLDLMFHPAAQDPSNALLINHMLETFDWLENTPEAEALLQNVTVPNPGAGLGLVSRDCGQDAALVDATDTRLSIMNAMMTPIRQGKIGSCFSTAPIIKMRQEDPLKTMKAFRDLAQNGVFKPEGGLPPVPAIVNLPADDNPLIRSLEATVATSGVQQNRSHKNRVLARSVGEIGKLISKGAASGIRKSVEKRLANEIWAAVELSYEPEAVIPVAADGRSSKGRYVLKNKDTGLTIADEAEYKALITRVIREVAADPNSGLAGLEQDLIDQLDKKGFAKALQMDGRDPWNLASGGSLTDTYKVLYGSVALKDVVGKQAVNKKGSAQRAVNVLHSIARASVKLPGDPDPDRMLNGSNASAKHAYNILPFHPDMQALTRDGPGQIGAKITTEVIDKAAELARTPVPAERLAGCYEALVADKLKGVTDPALKQALENALRDGMPQQAMTPSVFQKHCATAFAVVHQRKAQMKDEEAQANGGPAMSKKQKQQTEQQEYASDWSAIHNKLLNALDVRSFVVADTNWGDADQKTLLAVFPDPVTGLPVFGIKKEPPGTLEAVSGATKFTASPWECYTKANGDF